MRSDEPVAVALIGAIRGGDLAALAVLLEADDGLGGRADRIPARLAHAAEGGGRLARLLPERAAGGADAAGRRRGPRSARGPAGRDSLHWAASSDDVEVAEALIDGGADLEAPGGSIAVTPLANAVGYGCWQVARLLVARGARVDWLWQAAALGLRARVEELVEAATAQELNDAFWQACHGGQRRTAEYLLARGAEINAHPSYAEQTPLAIAGAPDTQRSNLVEWLTSRGAV